MHWVGCVWVSWVRRVQRSQLRMHEAYVSERTIMKVRMRWSHLKGAVAARIHQSTTQFYYLTTFLDSHSNTLWDVAFLRCTLRACLMFGHGLVRGVASAALRFQGRVAIAERVL